MSRYARRRRRNAIASTLMIAAAATGCVWLMLVLGALLWEGIGGLSLRVLTESTPPPGAKGGLLNAITGSLMICGAAVAVGTPLGVLAGTWMAEYGRYSPIAPALRIFNDVLLSAPSIVIGLFVYELVVAPSGHFSGYAGACALALIVVPVVVRTTEDMLLLVPNELREAAAAIGAPRAVLIARLLYRGAGAGLLTGVLLAVARISGETAPLMFTSLNNQFFNLDMSRPIASLPVVIFQFALSPYRDWQQLAWSGALIVTLAVLALNVTARLLTAARTSA